MNNANILWNDVNDKNLDGRKYYIVASIIKIMENDLDFCELPIFPFI